MIKDKNYYKEQSALIMREGMAAVGLDGSPGTALDELIIRPLSGIKADMDVKVADVYDNLSITEASDEYAEKLLANIGLTLDKASEAHGYLNIIVLADTAEIIIRNGLTFMYNGGSVIVTEDVIGIDGDADTITDNIYRVLRQYDTEHKYITVSCRTAQPIDKAVLRGTKLRPATDVTGLDSAEIAYTIAPPSGIYTLDDLRKKAPEGISAPVLGGPVNIKALMLENGITDCGVIGMFDDTMLRDSHNSYGLPGGGCVDIYIKTAAYPTVVEYTTNAVLRDGVYIAEVPADASPGFINIGNVITSNGSIITPSSVTFGFITDSDRRVIREWRDARYSAFQNCQVAFEYDAGGVENVTVTLELITLPGVKETQGIIDDPELNSPTADHIVKACVPVDVSCSCSILVRRNYPIPPTDEVAQVIADIINTKVIGSSFLSSTEIALGVANKFPGAILKTPVRLTGSYTRLDGSSGTLSGVDSLNIPTIPTDGVSPDNSFFCAAPVNINVMVEGGLL